MEHLSDLVEDLRARLAQVRAGGSEKARQKHHARGKLLARERVDRLLDPGSPFLELSALAATGMYDGPVPSAGIVTGIGRVQGREVMVIAAGHAVAEGDVLGVMEAMKMEVALRAPHAGTIVSGGAVAGEQVSLGARLFQVEPTEEED